MELFFIAPNGVDLCHAGHQPQLWPDNPILQRTQRHRVIRFAIFLSCIGLSFNRVVEYFTQPCSNRTHDRLNARGHLTLGLLQALIDEIAREIDISALLKNDGDL